MAGHSHWAGIKHKKKLVDQKRGKVFSKLTKNIMNAARIGGGNPASNLDLSYAIQRAKDANMTKDSIERAVKKGTGELPGQTLEWVLYEGYARGGVAVLVQALTDNKTRTVAEIRNIFEKHGNSLGHSGCVAWMFERKGLITLDAEGADEDEVLTTALEAGADDVTLTGTIYEVYTAAEALQKVRKALEDNGFAVQSGEVSYIPTSVKKLEADDARKVLSFLDTLEENDDVQNLYANYEISEELIEQLA